MANIVEIHPSDILPGMSFGWRVRQAAFASRLRDNSELVVDIHGGRIQPLPHPDNRYVKLGYEVLQILDDGDQRDQIVLRAKVNIKEGTTIMQEKKMFPMVTDSTLPGGGVAQFQDKVLRVCQEFEALDEDRKYLYLSLPRAEWNVNENLDAMDAIVDFRFAHPVSAWLSAIVNGIYNSNLHSHFQGGGIFTYLSRLGHSCLPNCQVIPTINGDNKLIAARDIKAGEILTMAYVQLFHDSQQAFSGLLNRWVTLCECEVCAHGARWTTMARRNKIRRLAHDMDFLQCRYSSEIHGRFLVCSNIMMGKALSGPISPSVKDERNIYATMKEFDRLVEEDGISLHIGEITCYYAAATSLARFMCIKKPSARAKKMEAKFTKKCYAAELDLESLNLG